MKVVTSSFCHAVARHSALRARPGDAESTDLSVCCIIRPYQFEFYAWVLVEDDRCDDRRLQLLGQDSVAHVAPKRVSDRVDDTERVREMSSRRCSASPTGVGAASSFGKDVNDDKVQVERDVKEVALSVLANEVPMARSDEKIRKAKVTEIFMETETCRAGLMDASTFKVRVHRRK